MPEKMMQPWQRSRIYGLCRELGMTTKSDDKTDELHLLISSRSEKDTLTGLTFSEAASVIGELEHNRRFAASATPTASKKFVFKEIPGGISERQYKKIVALMCELRKYDEKPYKATIEMRVSGIIWKYLHVNAPHEDPYRWLKGHHGVKLINTLNGMLATAKQKAGQRRETG
jgi:hypothetical protein